jgi:predicted deacetylase
MDSPLYLIRFDDVCPSMNWKAWEKIEKLLIKYSIKPILAVVPDNRDPALNVDTVNTDFWCRVKEWQARGYTIALHGHNHVYVNKNSGLLRLNARSEFAGLDRSSQTKKIDSALRIFSNYGVSADAWVAPSHSFDAITLDVLREFGITIVSDGLSRWPYRDSKGTFWIPQQIWEFGPQKEGVWTVCYHHNSWSDERIMRFDGLLDTYGNKIISVKEVLKRYAERRMTLFDRVDAELNWFWNHSNFFRKTGIRNSLSKIRSLTR